MKKLRVPILFLLIIGLGYGCIQTPDPEYPKRVNYTFNVAGVGDTLEVNQDQLYVRELKILAEKINIHVMDGTVIESRPDGLVMGYSETIEDDELVLGANIGYEDLNRFNGLDLFIAPPADNANVRDNDFFGGGNNYSLVVKGSYNENDFTYTSDPNFEVNFEFDQIVELSDSEPTLVLRVLLDIEEIFTSEEGKILDPEDQENHAVIDSLMQESIDLDAYSANNPFE